MCRKTMIAIISAVMLLCLLSACGATQDPLDLPDDVTDPSDVVSSKKKRDSLSCPVWSECRDSNSRPLEPHSSAIPNFATPGSLLVLCRALDDFDILT